MRFKGWVEVVLSYDINAVNKTDAEIQLESAVRRIKNQLLLGVPEVLDWGIDAVEDQQTES